MINNNRGKVIWYVSHYIGPPEFDTHSRALKFTQYLQDAGYEVIIFGSAYLHNKNIDLITDRSVYLERNYGDFKFVHIRCHRYKTNGISRFFSLFQFSARLFLLKSKFRKPDFIIHTAQVPFENLVLRLARSLKAKYISEVLDLWPESFVAYGLISRKNPLLALAYKSERWLYSKADKVIFSMEGGRKYITDKGWDKDNGGTIDLKKVAYINNGVDLKSFDENKIYCKTEDPDLDNENIIRVTYIGSIRHVNNLRKLIDAAALLLHYSNIKFLIYGDGGDRKILEEFCTNNSIDNVIFKQKWVELKYVPYILSRSSLNIVNHMPNDILRYGGSQGKLFQYMAAGKPICSNLEMGFCKIKQHSLGVSHNFETAREYADAIISILFADKEVYDGMCKRARDVAEEFDYKYLSEKLKLVLQSC